MTLPIINTPTYQMEIPSTKKTIKYRSFLVKEEKLILIAMQEMYDDKIQVVVDAIKQIIINCTFGELDPDLLTPYDLEYIFLQLKKKSSGSTVPISFICHNIIEGKSCNETNNITLNLDDVKLIYPKNRKNKIMLTDTIGVILKEPTLDIAGSVQEILLSEDINKIYETIYSLVDEVFEGETIYSFTIDELKKFMERLSSKQFQKIREFFETSPTLKLEIKIKCKKCGQEEVVILEGLQSFLV